MKKSLLAVALLGACAGAANAQTSVQMYGNLDAGIVKRSGENVSIGKRAANTLGIRGTEDLGNGFKALFHLEMRYEPDTGSSEIGPGGNQRQLFQGQSRVGLQGDFGMLRIGRGLTPFHETIGNFEPFHAIPTAGGFYTDLSVAGYSSQPLDPVGSSGNRWSNAIWYNSPIVNGFQLNTAIATKENNGGVAVIGRGSAGAPQYPVGASVHATPELKLMGTFTRLDEDHTRLFNSDTTSWVLGANYTLGPGKFLAGYGQKDTDGLEKVRQLSLGYEYSLSKRTYLYIDASRKKGLLTNPGTVNQYDIGINHSF